MTMRRKKIIFLIVLCSFLINCDSPSKIVFDNPRDPGGIIYSIPGNIELTDHGVSVASGTEYTVRWSKADRATAYLLQEAANLDFTKARADTLTETSKSFTHTEQTLKTYYYRVRAIHNGYQGEWSSTQDIIVKPLPPEVPIVTDPGSSVDSATSYTLFWKDTDRAVSYTIEEAADNTFTSASSRTVTSTSAVFSHDTTIETTYYYRVRSNNEGGISDWSNTVDMTVKKRITDGTIHIDISWPE